MRIYTFVCTRCCAGWTTDSIPAETPRHKPMHGPPCDRVALLRGVYAVIDLPKSHPPSTMER